MLLLLWNYLKGYVIIKISGFSAERFLNLAAVKNIYLWDVSRTGASAVAKVRLSGLYEAEKCAAKTGCEITVLGKRGLPFFIKRFKHRQILAAGGIAFILMFYGLSLFIWSTEFNGNDRVATEDIKEYCEEKGLYPGGLKLKCNPKAVSEGLVTDFNDVLWAAVEIKGTKAYVNIVETIKETPITDRVTPSDIVADKDGIILSIAASAGTPKVRAGDVVAKGDILIASEVAIKEGDEVKGYNYVAAGGAVTALVTYDIEVKVNTVKTEKEYTGEVLTDTAVAAGESVINIIKPALDGYLYDVLYSDDIRLKIGDYIVPVGIKRYEYRIYNENKITLTEEEAKALLDTEADNKLEEEMPFGAVVTETEKRYYEEGGIMTLNATVNVSEKIGTVDLNIRRNAQGGAD